MPMWEKNWDIIMNRRHKVSHAYNQLLAQGERPGPAKIILARRFRVALATIYQDLKYVKQLEESYGE